jgi:hypothetical protein
LGEAITLRVGEEVLDKSWEDRLELLEGSGFGHFDLRIDMGGEDERIKEYQIGSKTTMRERKRGVGANSGGRRTAG